MTKEREGEEGKRERRKGGGGVRCGEVGRQGERERESEREGRTVRREKKGKRGRGEI